MGREICRVEEEWGKGMVSKGSRRSEFIVIRRAKRLGEERKVWKWECRVGDAEMPDCIVFLLRGLLD